MEGRSADWFVPQIIAALDKEHSTEGEAERLRKYNTAAEEDARRLARYDEAIRLLRLREPGCSGDGEFISSVDLNKLTAAFLAAEGRK